MPFKKGNKLGRGRPRGSKNRFSTLKASFIEAYEKLGGTRGLLKWIKENPKNKAAFYHDLVRLIPTRSLEDIKEEGLLKFELSEKYMPKIMRMPRPGDEDALKIEVVRTITDDRERVIDPSMPRRAQGKKESAELKEQKEKAREVKIEALSTEQIEEEIKKLEEKKKEIKRINEAPLVN